MPIVGLEPTWPGGPRPLACWDCGFESHRGHWCLSFWVLCVASATYFDCSN